NQLDDRAQFEAQLAELERLLGDAQRSSIALQRSWSKLLPEDCGDDVDEWWHELRAAIPESLTHREQAVLSDFAGAKRSRELAEHALRPWIVRHNKGEYWPGTTIVRR